MHDRAHVGHARSIGTVDVIELRAPTSDATATVVLGAGGRVGSLVVDGTEVIVRGDADEQEMLWGSFPMAPWAGRVRNGRFTHDGVEHRLPLTLPPHAAHGTVFAATWQRTDDGTDQSAIELRTPLGPDWPLGGTASQRIRLEDDALRCTLTVVAGDRSMPAEVGWHPWFRSAGPIEMEVDAMYERGADHLPTGRLLELGPPPWDDCFRNTRPVRFPVGPLEVTVSSDADHTVIFTELDRGIAVEPQSGPPDAFNLHPRVLQPGESLTRTMTIAWRLSSRTDG